MKKNLVKVVLGAVAFAALVATAPLSQASSTRTLVCHKGRTIVVDDDAVPGHLGHGDTLGPCIVF